MEEVVCGPEGRSRGLVRCEFSERPKSYDHPLHCQKSQGGHAPPQQKLRAWDFVLIRDDGTGLRVHPEWIKNNISTAKMEGHAEEVPPPERGLGNSDGPGTYKHYKTVCSSGPELKFDKSKRPRG